MESESDWHLCQFSKEQTPIHVVDKKFLKLRERVVYESIGSRGSSSDLGRGSGLLFSFDLPVESLKVEREALDRLILYERYDFHLY